MNETSAVAISPTWETIDTVGRRQRHLMDLGAIAIPQLHGAMESPAFDLYAQRRSATLPQLIHRLSRNTSTSKSLNKTAGHKCIYEQNHLASCIPGHQRLRRMTKP